MAKIDIISLSDDTFIDVGLRGIDGLTVCNTDTEDITFDLVIGPKTLDNKNVSTDAIFVLKDIPVPIGSTFVFDDNGVLSGAFSQGSKVNKYEVKRRKFLEQKNFTFLVRVGSGHTADVFLRR